VGLAAGRNLRERDKHMQAVDGGGAGGGGGLLHAYTFADSKAGLADQEQIFPCQAVAQESSMRDGRVVLGNSALAVDTHV
jgi:hypothetical protein